MLLDSNFSRYILLGQVNAGKSSIFNVLTSSRDALVGDYSGLTVDFREGYFNYKTGEQCLIVDAPGYTSRNQDVLSISMFSKYVPIYVVDGFVGITSADQNAIDRLRKTQGDIIYVVSKSDLIPNICSSDFFYRDCIPLFISVKQGYGIESLKERIEKKRKDVSVPYVTHDYVFSLVGRPNAGKSSFINVILGTTRMKVSDCPGTTRESIPSFITYGDKKILLYDTAGVRKKRKIVTVLEKNAIKKTTDSIRKSDVVLLFVDVKDFLCQQDNYLIQQCRELSISLLLIFTKCDSLNIHENKWNQYIKEKMFFFPLLLGVDFVAISSLTEDRQVLLTKVCSKCMNMLGKKETVFSTNDLNRWLQSICHIEHPLKQGIRPKIKYVCQKKDCKDITFVAIGSRLQHLNENYKKYILSSFRKYFQIQESIPVHFIYKNKKNPYIFSTRSNR